MQARLRLLPAVLLCLSIFTGTAVAHTATKHPNHGSRRVTKTTKGKKHSTVKAKAACANHKSGVKTKKHPHARHVKKSATACAAKASHPTKKSTATKKAEAAAAAAASSSSLFGTQTVEPTADSNPAGSAQAFAVTNQTAGTANSVSVYVGSGNAAKTMNVGLYANNNGNPGKLLASGSVAGPQAGAWNTVPVTSTTVAAGKYWIAVLGTGGSVAFRDEASGTCTTETSRQDGLSSLPSSWTTGGVWTNKYCPISAYVSGSGSASTGSASTGSTGSSSTSSGTSSTSSGSSSSSGGSSGASTGSSSTGSSTGATGSSTTSTTTTVPSGATNCAGAPGSGTVNQASLTACGLPSMNNTGPAANTSMTSSGGFTASTAGAVYNGLNVNGGITIAANNVTIENSDITDVNLSNAAIIIENGVTGTKIINDSIHGDDNGNNALAFGVSNLYGNTLNSVTIDHTNFYNGDRILVGYGTVTNSYCLGGASFGSEHDECIYTSGGSPGISVIHDTLLNANPWQTAAVFVDSPDGSGSNGEGTVDIENSLLGGGGYCLYGGEGGEGTHHSGPETIANNRFANLYFSDCGQFGPDAYVPSDVNWSGNVWDDSNQAIPAP